MGWNNYESQETRFEKTFEHVDFGGKIVLDIGCGFGDFYPEVDSRFLIANYKGIDINDTLLEEARRLYPHLEFENINILLNNYKKKQADIVVAFGLLNFKIEDNLAYTKKFIESAWSITKETLVVDFLSSHLDNSYPEEGAVYYHNPKDVLDICFELTDNVVLVHDYQPIPQKEFMIILRR